MRQTEMTPIYFAHKLSNHKYSKIDKISPDKNSYKTKHTYMNIKHKIFEELLLSVLTMLKKKIKSPLG